MHTAAQDAKRNELIEELTANNATDEVDVHAVTNAFVGFYDSCLGDADDGQFFQVVHQRDRPAD